MATKRIRLVITTKEFGEMVGRSSEWVRDQCRAGKIPTFPRGQKPYLIPRKALMRCLDLDEKPPIPPEFIPATARAIVDTPRGKEAVT